MTDLVLVKLITVPSMVIAAVLLFWLARVSARGTLKRNLVAGYRTSTTLTNDATWRAGHLASVRFSALAGVVAAVTALAIGLSSRFEPAVWWCLGGCLVMLAVVLAGAVAAQRAAKEVLRSGRHPEVAEG
ncbi:MAG: SdpI family protein [Bowdeniella nasicola]|nr:SdpI family protein [Bowdeniella nasicola]